MWRGADAGQQALDAEAVEQQVVVVATLFGQSQQPGQERRGEVAGHWVMASR